MIAHIVLFNAKDGVDIESRRLFARKLAECTKSIEAILRARVGRRAAVDAGYNRQFGDKTYEYAAILEFGSRTGLVEYLTNPLHNDLGMLFWEYCQDTIITEVEYSDISTDNGIDMLVK